MFSWIKPQNSELTTSRHVIRPITNTYGGVESSSRGTGQFISNIITALTERFTTSN